MSKDTQTRFHEEWLGLVQPIEGLVFSIPVLADAQITPSVGVELSTRFSAQLARNDEQRVHVDDLRRLFREFLAYATPGMLVERDELPAELHFYAEEGRQDIRPSFAIARGPFESPDDDDDLFAGFGEAPEPAPAPSTNGASSPYLALVWDLRDDGAPLGTSLDKPEDATGPWRYPPTA
jgi:hypothetical protein